MSGELSPMWTGMCGILRSVFTRGYSTFATTMNFALFVASDDKSLKLRTYILFSHKLQPSVPVLACSDTGFP